MYNILIVDDEQNLLDFMENDFREFNDEFSIFTTSKSNAVSAMLEELSIDLLISDIFMPDKDGLELIREVRGKYPDLKIIAMSGSSVGNGTYLHVAEILGSAFTLQKPFSMAELASAIEVSLS